MKTKDLRLGAALSCAAAAVLMLIAAPASAAPATKDRCSTIARTALWFGQEDTRSSAVSSLNNAIAEWRAGAGNPKVKEVKRNVNCKVYLEFLNEYECTAQAVLCK